MSPLGDLFGEAESRAARDAEGAQLPADRLGAVHTRVRRAHARRAALRTGMVAIAFVVVGAGALYGISRMGPGPAADAGDAPTVSSSPSGTASTSPSPGLTDAAWPGFAGTVTVDSHLPDAAPITPEVWASAGPGWALVSYRESWVTSSADVAGTARGPQVIYLVSPEGDRYELLTLDDEATVEVLAWTAGQGSARVTVVPDNGAEYGAVLDLASGHMVAVDGYSPDLWSLAFLDADGAPVWRGNDATAAYMSIAPDGTQSAFEIPAEDGAVELAETEFGPASCVVAAPFDADSSLVRCGGDDYPDRGPKYIARVAPGAGTVDLLYQTSGDKGVGTPFRAGTAVIAPVGGVDCVPTLAVLVDGGYSPIPGATAGLHPDGSIALPFGAVGTQLVWGTTSGCSGESSGLTVISSDLAAGTYSVLVPYPVDRPQGEVPIESVTGVAVAH